MSGLEELLGYIADWIGLDLRGRSLPRIIAIVLLYTLAGILLLAFGLYSLAADHDGAVSILSGVICSALGLAFLVRIGTNIARLLRQHQNRS